MNVISLQQIADPKPDDFAGETKDVLAYWHSIAGEDSLPAWSMFDWMQMPLPVIPWCSVGDIVSYEPIRVAYRFWGTQRVGLFGKEYTGKTSDDIADPEARKRILREYLEVAAARTPIIIEKRIKLPGETHAYHMLRLPFTNNTASDVTHVLSALFISRPAINALEGKFRP